MLARSPPSSSKAASPPPSKSASPPSSKAASPSSSEAASTSSSKAASPSLPRAVLLSPGETPPAKITAAANDHDEYTGDNVAADLLDDRDSAVDKGTLKTTTVHKEGDGDTVTRRVEMIPLALLLKADNNTPGGHQAINGSGGGDATVAAVSGESGDTSGGLVRNGGEVVGGGANNRRPPPDERTPLIQQDIRGR
jgi:hypothetical protein